MGSQFLTLLEALEEAALTYQAEQRTGPMRVTIHFHNGVKREAVIESEHRMGDTRIIVARRVRLDSPLT